MSPDPGGPDGTSREEIDARADRLAALARAGDAEAFEDLCRLLADDVWRYCHALLGDREQAFDATQDTFARAVTGIRRWRGDAPFRVYLLVMARRAVADLLRAEQRRRRLVSSAEPVDPPAPAGTGSVELAELIDQLDPDQRQAFVLTRVLGLRYDEAAVVAGVAIGTIRSRVHRARARLAEAVRVAEAAGDRDPHPDHQPDPDPTPTDTEQP